LSSVNANTNSEAVVRFAMLEEEDPKLPPIHPGPGSGLNQVSREELYSSDSMRDPASVFPIKADWLAEQP